MAGRMWHVGDWLRTCACVCRSFCTQATCGGTPAWPPTRLYRCIVACSFVSGCRSAANCPIVQNLPHAARARHCDPGACATECRNRHLRTAPPQAVRVHTLMLDTTYCSPKWVFPPQVRTCRPSAV